MNHGYKARITQNIQKSRRQEANALGRSFVNDMGKSLADLSTEAKMYGWTRNGEATSV
jgi:hypothetical protein